MHARQCSYIVDAIQRVQEEAGERNMELQVVELASAQEVHERAPSPYGVYNLVYDGDLLTYQPYVPGGILKLLDRRAGAQR